MYYKIINKESEIYKKLYELRSKELSTAKDNLEKIEAKVGLKFDKNLGYPGQTFHRIRRYIGFEFVEPDKIDKNIWKEAPENPGIYIPNRRFAKGREMAEFLASLPCGTFSEVFEIFGFRLHGRFYHPYVEIVGDVIILFLDDKHEPNDDNVIEITKKEFNQLSDDENDS